MKEVTDTTFEADVLQADKPVVVDFWAPWCGPCRAIAPILEQFAEEQPSMEFTKVNIDDNPNFASRYGVLSIPTVILFENGEPQETVIGARPRGYFENAFSRWLS
ncbi:MAG TPA: thioredoxin [Gaiellaceae bacterium]|nr:thioredoxin [Gaiellaceae bacterium]